MSRKTKVKIFKIILLLFVLLIVLGAIIYLWPLFKDISTESGRIKFQEKIQSSGFLGLLMLFGLQFSQIFLIVIPGEPIEILAGMCYGTFWGTVFITVSAFLISTIVFLTVRSLGRKFVYSFCDENQVKKIEKSKIFQNPKKVEWIMMLLFLIPGTPKDLLVYISGLLPIKTWSFLLISTFARLPSVISSTIAGSNILDGNIKMIIISYAITFLLVGVVIFIIAKFDKTKTTEEALKLFQKKDKNKRKK